MGTERDTFRALIQVLGRLELKDQKDVLSALAIRAGLIQLGQQLGYGLIDTAEPLITLA